MKNPPDATSGMRLGGAAEEEELSCFCFVPITSGGEINNINFGHELPTERPPGGPVVCLPPHQIRNDS